MAEWSNAEVCKTSYRGFESHPELSFQNRLTGRTPPFEGVYLGSNPSSGIVHVAQWKRHYLEGVVVGGSNPLMDTLLDWCNGSTMVSKTISGSSNLSSFAYSLSSVDLEQSATNRCVAGSNPAESVWYSMLLN